MRALAMIRRSVITAIPQRINYGLADFRDDVLGGLTAAAVALPVALSYGVISGLGPTAGLYGAVALGLFAATLGGTRAMIYGPNLLVAILMSVVVAEYATSIAEAATAGILAGLIQIGIGLLRLGRYAAYIPYSLMSGFLTAVGILLIVKEGLVALGDSPAGRNVVGAIRAYPAALGELKLDALALTVLCLALGMVWRGRLQRLSPPAFVMLIAGTLVGVIWFRETSVIGEIPLSIHPPDLSVVSLDFFARVLPIAFIMALLASVDTVIVAMALDSITGSKNQPNREMIAQGIGNIAAGSIGVLAGSSTQGCFNNAHSGGRSPVAGLTVVVAFLAVILFLAPVAAQIPLAVLAAILIRTGWSLIEWRFILRIHRIPKSYVFVMLITCGLILFVDFVIAITVGLVVAGLTSARRLENLEVSSLLSVPLLDLVVLDEADPRKDVDIFAASTGLVVFPDRVTVASAPEISRIVRPDIREHQITVFDMSRTVYVDDSAAFIIGDLIKIATARSPRTLVIAGLTDSVANTLNTMGTLDRVPEKHVVANVEEAKRIIRPMLRATR